MKNGQFLQVEKRLWALAQHDCKLIHIMLLAQIQEFQRNKCDCYMTDKQFAENFGESERTVGRALKKLEEMNLIKRDTKFVTGYGRANRQRTLSVEEKALNKLVGKLPKEKAEKASTYESVQQKPAEIVDNRPEWERSYGDAEYLCDMAKNRRFKQSDDIPKKPSGNRPKKLKESGIDIQAMLDNGEF